MDLGSRELARRAETHTQGHFVIYLRKVEEKPPGHEERTVPPPPRRVQWQGSQCRAEGLPLLPGLRLSWFPLVHRTKEGAKLFVISLSAELAAALRLVLRTAPHSRNLASAKPCKLLSNLLLVRLLTVERSQATKGPEKPQRLAGRAGQGAGTVLDSQGTWG